MRDFRVSTRASLERTNHRSRTPPLAFAMNLSPFSMLSRALLKTWDLMPTNSFEDSRRISELSNGFRPKAPTTRAQSLQRLRSFD